VIGRLRRDGVCCLIPLGIMIFEIFDEGLEVGRCGRRCGARGEDLCFTGRINIVPAVSQMSPNNSRTPDSLILGCSDDAE